MFELYGWLKHCDVTQASSFDMIGGADIFGTGPAAMFDDVIILGIIVPFSSPFSSGKTKEV